VGLYNVGIYVAPDNLTNCACTSDNIL